MTIRHYFVIAVERPYNPKIGETITYCVEPDTSLRRSVLNGGGKQLCEPAAREIVVHVTHMEESWGPDTTRVEGYTRNPHTHKVNQVRGHHRTKYPKGTTRVGVLQVTEDD